MASIFTHIHNHLLFYISFSVENALCSLFRMTRKSSSLLFPTLASSDKLLMHFRFIAHSFVANLSEYVFDTAIGGNFDPFLSRLSPDAPSILYDGRVSGFSDVFSLAKAHSTLLDDILSACLLRSGQRGVGDLLRHSLELVLEFAVLAGELKNGRLQEYQAAPLLDDLFQSFRGKMTTLVSLNITYDGSVKLTIRRQKSSRVWSTKVLRHHECLWIVFHRQVIDICVVPQEALKVCIIYSFGLTMVIGGRERGSHNVCFNRLSEPISHLLELEHKLTDPRCLWIPNETTFPCTRPLRTFLYERKTFSPILQTPSEYDIDSQGVGSSSQTSFEQPPQNTTSYGNRMSM